MEPSPNGQIESHESRLQRVEQNTSELAKRIAELGVKVDTLNNILEQSGARLNLTLERATEAIESIHDRIRPLEEKEMARTERSSTIKKAFFGMLLAGIGALGSQLVIYFFGRL